ncbi:hemerythrin domain-containing protein [Actinocorallia populi]|uniref:hemerythrin domain-containing protein n=1 Tax=Actinocorallia populi TaxID=2079200 RepID=UPI000D08995F|nr:hemerythrin domain-containing protein [Actinocorallia populi]
MDDVFTVLENGHREIRRMLRELESSPNSANGANQAALARRRQLVDRLIMEHSQHESAEQECFWPAVRELMANGAQMAEQGVRQEQSAQQTMADLRNIDPQEQKFEEQLRTAAQEIKAHIDFEEQQVLPALRKVMDPQRAQQIGAQIAQRKQAAAEGRARPHAAPRPGALKGTAQARSSGGGSPRQQGQQGQQNQKRGQQQNQQNRHQEQEQEQEQSRGREKPKDTMGRGR